MPDFKNKYIVIKTHTNSEIYDENSLCSFWIDKNKGISHILGRDKKTKEVSIAAFVFEIDKWKLDQAQKWVKGNFDKRGFSQASLFNNKITRVNNNLILCSSFPKLAISHEVEKLTKENWEKYAQSNLNDKFILFVEGVHEGMNGNGDYFYAEELTKNYRSAAYQPIDWEHDRYQVIGSSIESELISRQDHPLALGINGIINRLSPYVQMEDLEDEKVMSRDEIIKQRYYNEQLAISMECLFDSMKCTECGFETTDWLEFDFHVYTRHFDKVERGELVGRGLIGVDFIGWGIVKKPADGEAYIGSLRTSDDGTIKEIVASQKQVETLGPLAKNVAFSNEILKLEPQDIYCKIGENYTFASEIPNLKKNNDLDENNNTKNAKKCDKLIDKNSNISGGLDMKFNLKEKLSKATSLAEVFKVAHEALRDVVKNKTEMTDEVYAAFTSELDEVLKLTLANKDVNIDLIFSLTEADKEKAIAETISQKETEFNTVKAELDVKISALESEKTQLKADLDTKLAELAQKEKEAAETEKKNKIDGYIKELKEAGISLTDSLEASYRKLIEANLDNAEFFPSFKKDLIASIKTTELLESSLNGGGAAAGGHDDDNRGNLFDKLNKEREKYLKNDKK